MEEHPQKNKRQLRQKLKKPYRLVVLKEDSLEEVTNTTLTPLNLYILISSVLVGVTLVVVLLIVFTPLKRWIPGYGDASMNPEVIQLRKQVNAMENQLALQQRYTDNIRQILTGSVPEPVSEESSGQVTLNDSLLQVERVAEDELLRENFALGEGLVTPRSTVNQPVTPIERLYFIPPVRGDISARFRPDQNHFGVDILAPKNTPIQSALDGTVIFSDWTLETGNTIGILHDQQIVTFYKHNSTLLKEKGARVRAGEAIAIIGNTGTLSSGPHLHFELWQEGQPVDPTRYINFR